MDELTREESGSDADMTVASEIRIPVDKTIRDPEAKSTPTDARIAALEQQLSVHRLANEMTFKEFAKLIAEHVEKKTSEKMAGIEAAFTSLIARIESRLSAVESGNDGTATKALLDERNRQLQRHAEHLTRLETKVQALMARVDK